MRQIRLLEEAAQEAIEAAAWYEQERTGLGRDFSQAVEAALDLLQDGIVPPGPMPGTAGKQGTARLILKRFPYDIVVYERPKEILIVAVAHHARRPGYWRSRLRT